ncbi:Aste57867_4337 [Aphanomyces stellatus]|uniref:Aste57867_4337 protein n=1 Tax=Aphanomyces stellatus TaxID=120398 RepID=A0A485KGH8_9STRA|nr:hypothetical protein As57867_004326 [Aphanomyces stellatus]VFT81451.1 Aste57867_4337 [Aphanomyces stellatus]
MHDTFTTVRINGSSSGNPTPASLAPISNPDPNLVHAEEEASTKGKFACCHDIQLLRQVALLCPWEAEFGKLILAWDDNVIQLGLSSAFKLKTKGSALKTRFNTLMSKFKAGDVALQRKSGTTEEYEEHTQLHTDIKSRMDDFNETEVIETSGVLLRRMADAELEGQGRESDTPKKR